MGQLTLLVLTSLAIHYSGALNLNTHLRPGSRYEAAAPETKEKLVDTYYIGFRTTISYLGLFRYNSLFFPGCLVSRWFGRASERFKFCFRRQ